MKGWIRPPVPGGRYLAVACVVLAPLLVAAQGASPPACAPVVTIDTPATDATVRGETTIAGWALDLAAGGRSGVEEVHVYLDGTPGIGRLLGAAQLGGARPDVDAAYGLRASSAGWSLRLDAKGLEPGGHLLTAYARTRCGWTSTDRTMYVAPVEGWALLNPPSGRSAHGVAWDSTRGRLYMLGGRGGGTHADLWVYRSDLNVWSPVQPVGGSVPRLSAHTLVWDPVGQQLLIFGGFGADRSDALWVYRPGENRVEEVMALAPRPMGRGYHTAVWTGEAMLVFGGVGGRFDLFEDLWSYDPRAQRWTRLLPEEPGPSARFYHAAVWDPIRAQMLVFGGFDLETGLLDDLWSYQPDANRWTRLEPEGPTPPSRLSASMVWDPAAGRVLLYGGGCGGCYRDDLWSYHPDLNRWEQVEPAGERPAPRGGHRAVWDERGNRMLLVAGGESLNDLWSYSAATQRWARLTPARTVISALSGGRAVWDPSRAQMLVFGGDTGAADPGPTDIIHVYRPATHTWETIPTGGGPGVRTGHSVVWDEDGGQALLFGGRRDDGSLSGEVWSYTPLTGRWTRLADARTGPVPRAFHSAVWDPAGRQMLVFGGANDRGAALDDLWSFQLPAASWTLLPSGGPAPKARVRHSAVWDPTSREMLLFGGYQDPAGYSSELWSYRPEERRWMLRGVDGATPQPRARHSAVWDPRSGRMLVFGGFMGGVEHLGDLWAYDPADDRWAELKTGQAPLPRADHAAVWDGASGQMLVYGGGASEPSNELWSYRPPAGIVLPLAPARTPTTRPALPATPIPSAVQS